MRTLVPFLALTLALQATAGAQSAPTAMEPVVVLGTPSETINALTPALRSRIRIVSADALSPQMVDKDGRVPAGVIRPGMPAPGPDDSHIVLVPVADYKDLITQLRAQQLTPVRYQSLLPQNLRLGQGRPCPNCLPVDPGAGTPRPGLPQFVTGSPATARLNACRDSARSLRRIVPQNLPCFVAGACTDAVPRTAADDYDTYIHSCLVAPQDLTNSPSAPTVSSTVSSELAAFAVLTRRTDGQPFCAALLVGPQTAVTVAHCFSGGIGAEEMVLRAYATPETGTPFTVSAAPPPAWAEYLADRPIVLDLVSPVAGFAAEPCLETPAPGEPLDLFGYMRDSLTDTGASWTSSIRTGAYTCSMTGSVDAQGHCFAHTCQAFPGFSGAPIFASPRPGSHCAVRVVGLQKSGGGDPGDFCGGTNRNGAFAAAGLPVSHRIQ